VFVRMWGVVVNGVGRWNEVGVGEEGERRGYDR